MKIDRRKSYYLMVDTETCNGFMDEKDKLDLSNSLVYDIGLAIVDKKGNVYESYSFVINEIFWQERDLMQSAYYSEKLPQYYNDIANNKRKSCNFYDVKKIARYLLEKYETDVVIAHNAYFDLNALNMTTRWITKSKERYFFPYGTEIWCTLNMARQVVAKTPTYKTFCEQFDFKTPTGRVSLTAETLYRYITFNPDFIESHTGLEDVMIEKEIFAYCLAKKKKMRKKLFKD